MRAFLAVLARALRLRLRGGGWAASLGLFVTACALAPLALGRDEALLAAAGPGLVWIAASLSVLLGLDGSFEEDARSGALDVQRLSPLPLPLALLAHAVAGWLTACLPLALASPLLLAGFGTSGGGAASGALGLLLGTPALALTATALGAMLSGLRRGTGLLVVLALPLFVPSLVFGPAACGREPGVPLLMLAASSLLALAVCPALAAAGLKAQDL